MDHLIQLANCCGSHKQTTRESEHGFKFSQASNFQYFLCTLMPKQVATQDFSTYSCNNQEVFYLRPVYLG